MKSMDNFNEDDSVDVRVGIEDSVDVGKDKTLDQIVMWCGTHRRKLIAHVWTMFEILPLAEEKTKRGIR